MGVAGSASEPREAIVATCTDYAISWLEGDPERMADCLHRRLVKRALADPASGSLDLDEAPYDAMVVAAARGPRPYGRELSIEVHDISEDIASASVLSEPWLDLVHLAWFGDRWRIVNVLYEPRATIVDAPADRIAVTDLLDAYARSAFDEDADVVLATHHPVLAERRVVLDKEGSRVLEELDRDEVVDAVRRGLDLERFGRTWQARVLEVGHDIAAVKVTMGWWDFELHLARFGLRWMIVNILYRTLPIDG